jgi:hypothetical protein
VDPAGAAAASQSDLIYPFEAWVADDYTSPGDEAIEKIQWWGTFFGPNPDPILQPPYWVVSFYNDPGNCDPGLAGTDPQEPTAPLFQRIITDFNFTDLGGGSYEYTALLDGVAGDDDMPVPQDAGRTYWLSIQAGMDFFTYGQWGWQPATGTLGCVAVQLFPFLGGNTWAPLSSDMAFCLYYVDDPIPVETSSWGSVKALYQ